MRFMVSIIIQEFGYEFGLQLGMVSYSVEAAAGSTDYV